MGENDFVENNDELQNRAVQEEETQDGCAGCGNPGNEIKVEITENQNKL